MSTHLEATSKSVSSLMQSLSLKQRQDVQVLVDQGMDPKVARAIVIGYGQVNKAKELSPEFFKAYYQRAKGYLPSNLHSNILIEARSAAGGHVAGKTRGKAETVNAKRQAEIDRLQARIDELSGAIEKTTVADVHVDTPLGSKKKT